VPLASEASLVPVNLKAIPTSTLGEHDTFVFRKDSAGFGVPRGSLGKLNSFSNQATQHGMASTNVYPAGAQRGAAQSGGASYSGPARSVSSAPSPSSGMQSASGMGASHATGPAGGGSSGGAGRH
jgi:hypothetical protein